MPRRVRVATLCQLNRGAPTVEANFKRVGALLEQAGTERPDIICLPEVWSTIEAEYEHVSAVAEPVPGPTTDFAAAYARRFGCYIICPLYALHGNQIVNAAVLMDRRGRIVGAYHKLHPVVTDATFTGVERGVTPGREATVFETDFGRIGMQICFDMNWDDGWAELKRRGAEIVFWPSAYDGGRFLILRALQYHYYVVSAVSTYFARIIHLTGDVLAVTGQRNCVAAHTLDLDVGLYTFDFNRVALPQIRAKYGPDVTLRVAHEEGLFTLESNRDDLTVAQIANEFLLDPRDAYLARNVRLQDALREGRPAPEQPVRYVGRPKWL